MQYYINEEKTIKPCVFFGALIMLANIFITTIVYLANSVNAQQWFYPNMVNDNFLILGSIGTILLVIGLAPGIKKYV